jgi:hypothetical protein
MVEVCEASRDPSLLEGLLNETLKANLQSSFKIKHILDRILLQ